MPNLDVRPVIPGYEFRISTADHCVKGWAPTRHEAEVEARHSVRRRGWA